MSETTNIILLFILTSLLIFVIASVLGFFYAIPGGNVVIIHIDGDIVSTSSLFSGAVTSDEVIDQIRTAESNPNVQAIVLSINSPGGMVVASKEIAEYVLAANKTVISWIREVGASGAYLISAASDYIICDNLSITGSIGVTSSYLEFSETLDKYGVDYVRVVTGEHKDMGSEYRNLTTEERDILMNMLNESFNYFLNFVINQRNLTASAINIVADGRIIIGSDAYRLGLVDELGGISAVEQYLHSIGISEIAFEDYSINYDIIPDLSDLLGFKSASSLPTYS